MRVIIRESSGGGAIRQAAPGHFTRWSGEAKAGSSHFMNSIAPSGEVFQLWCHDCGPARRMGLGRLIKIIDTTHIESDSRAYEAAEGELKRQQFETRDPSLRFIQLTEGEGREAVFVPRFAVYRP